MPWVRAWAVLAVVALVAGCFASQQDDAAVPVPSPPALPPETRPDGAIDYAAIAANLGEPIVVEHDHNQILDHAGSHNVAFVAWSRLGVTLGENGFANFVLHSDGDRTLAFVAIDGDQEGGFTIADITDPRNITVVGSYRAPGSGFQEVRVTPDGRTALQNVQALPSAGNAGGGLTACSACIHVVDIRDLTHPTLVSVLPVETRGTHNMDVVAYGADLYLFYVGQPATADNTPEGNRIGVARFVDTPLGMTLVPVSTFAHPALVDDGRSYPHDVLVQDHPDGRRIAYVSHWDGGLVTFAALNPLAVTSLGRNTEVEPSDALSIHWTTQEPRMRSDGRTIVWSAPEIGSLSTGSGAIRAYDGSDPALLRQVGTWQLPGNVTIPGQYVLSPHIAVPDVDTGLLAVSHYHAGVWILDITEPEAPRALGYYMPHGDPAAPYDGPIWWKKPNFDPEGFMPNVYQARWHGGLLWVTERGTGLYALEYTGPVPGKVWCTLDEPIAVGEECAFAADV